MIFPMFVSPQSNASTPSRSIASAKSGFRLISSRTVSLKDFVRGMLRTPLLVSDPSSQCMGDILLLAFLRAAPQQKDNEFSLATEVNAITGPGVDFQFAHAAGHPFDIRRIALDQTFQGSRNPRPRDRIEFRTPPFEGRPAALVKIKPCLDHLIGNIYDTNGQPFSAFLRRIASVRKRNALSLMKPAASFWS